MSTPSQTLEERVAALEAEVARIKYNQNSPTEPAEPGSAGERKAIPWWEQRLGAFRDSSEYEEAMRLGEEYRRSQPTPADSENTADE